MSYRKFEGMDLEGIHPQV